MVYSLVAGRYLVDSLSTIMNGITIKADEQVYGVEREVPSEMYQEVWLGRPTLGFLRNIRLISYRPLLVYIPNHTRAPFPP